MPEPTVAAAGLPFVVPAAAVPVLLAAPDYAPQLVMFGIQLGLRADVLLAGFAGAVAAITLLNSVPSSGDTLRELARTSLKRVGVAVGSAVTAGYIAPLFAFFQGIPESLVLGVAFVVGAGSLQLLPWLIERFGKKGAAAGGDQ